MCVAGVRGRIFSIGDAEQDFAIESISKLFVFALVCHTLGDEQARRKLGVNSTGLPFNSVMAIELNADRTMNPLVNAGAIATTSLVPGTTADEKFESIVAAMSRFAGRRLAMDQDVGLPGKSGVAGGIVTVSPGKGGLGTFSPPLDAAGNSVRGQHVTRYLSEALGLNLFASAPLA